MEPQENNSHFSDAFQLMQSRIGDLLRQQIDVHATVNAWDALSSIAGDMLATELDVSMRVAHEVTPVLLESIKQAAQVLSESYRVTGPIELPNSVLESFQELAPLVPEEKQEAFERVVAPAKEQKILTAENVKWLLGIIIPILFSYYLYQLPDKNAEEDLKLHQEEIAIENNKSELLEEGIELFHEFFDYLKENGISFPESTDAIEEDISTIEEDVDTFDDPALSGLETDDTSDQPSSQDAQE